MGTAPSPIETAEATFTPVYSGTFLFLISISNLQSQSCVVVLNARFDFLSNALCKMIQGRDNFSQQTHHEIFSLFICLGGGLWKRGRLKLLFNYAALNRMYG